MFLQFSREDCTLIKLSLRAVLALSSLHTPPVVPRSDERFNAVHNTSEQQSQDRLKSRSDFVRGRGAPSKNWAHSLLQRAYTCYIRAVLQVIGITYYVLLFWLERCWMKNISGIELHLGILWKFCSMPMEFWIQGLGNFSWVQSKQTKGNSSYCRALEIEWKKSLPLGCCIFVSIWLQHVMMIMPGCPARWPW